MRNSKPKKTDSIHVRFPERMKREIEEQARKNGRFVFQDEVLVLCAEALHYRKFSIEDFL